MIRRYGLRTKIYLVIGTIAWAVGIAGTLVASFSKADVSKIPAGLSFVIPTIVGIQGRSWFLGPICGIVAGGCVLIRKRIGEPWVWGAIHHLVNTYRDFVFADERQENLHHHRVTLFRHYRWWEYPCCFKRPFGSRLIPVARSGHTTQQSNIAFLVPDDADKSEGFAGKVWATFSTLIVSDLPDLSANPTDEKIKEYAKKVFCTEDWVRDRMIRNRIMGRSFCGIAIRVKGIEWGVIVIDSRSPKSIKKLGEKTYDLMGRSLGKLLERV